MNTFKRWLLQRTTELDRLYAHPDPHEAVWERSATIVHEAGDRAARLGLTELFLRSEQFGACTGPEEAKAFLSDCLGALSQPSPDKMLTLREAAALLGYTVKGLRQIVDRSRTQNGRHKTGLPTIEFSQAGRHGAIRFRREWVEAFIEENHIKPIPDAPAVARKTTIRAKKSHGLRYDLLGR